jgi:hypothetical protein
MTGFLRSTTGRAVIATGVAVAFAVFMFVPFPDDTGAGRRLFFSCVLGGFAAFGVWSLAGIPALVVDIVGSIRGHGARRAAPAAHHTGPLPELSQRRQGDVRRIVRVMASHGLFAPDAPDPTLLFASVAARDEPVKPDIVLDAILEVEYYHPGTDPTRWFGNLVMHGSQAEQDEAQQIADIARLASGELDVRDITVRRGALPGQPRASRVDVTMAVNGDLVTLGYAGHTKYLSTHIHHALACKLRAGGSGKRLAALWVPDQGVWLSMLADGSAEKLNAELKLGPRADCAWSWVDEEAPFAAGDVVVGQYSA